MEDVEEEAWAVTYAQFRNELINATDEKIISVYLKKIVDEGETYSNYMAVNDDEFNEDPRHTCLVTSPSFWNQPRTEACGRTDGCESGCWRIMGRDKLIKYKDTGKFLGFKRIFKFCKKTIPREYKRSWVMEEYRLLSKRNYVICKIQFLFQTEISFLLAKHFSYSSDTRPTQSLPVYGDLSGQGGAYYLEKIIGSGENKWPRDVTNDVYCLHPLTLVDPQDWNFNLTGLCIFANRTTASGFTDECDSGCWRIMDPDIPIISRSMKIPGFKRVFRFHEKEEKYNFYYTKCGADVKATWIMEEYRLADEGMKDRVLCVIILQSVLISSPSLIPPSSLRRCSLQRRLSRDPLTLPSPLRNHRLTNSIHFLKSRTLFSFSCFSSSSAAYLPALDEFSSTKGPVARDDNKKVILKGMSYASLQEWVESHGFRPGQAMMLWKRLYKDKIWAQDVGQLEGLNKDFKRMISEHAEFGALRLKDIRSASDGTRKILFTLDDGLVIETVVIPCDRGRTTVCVSSQVGCAMNCQFCFTGRMGLKRNLTAAEIVEQAVYSRRLLCHEFGSVTNVVFMGMGEPFHNIDNVIKAANIMVDENGLHFSPRKVTVSTSGLVPQLKQFLRESKCALAVSLNATTDEVRNWIMPINRKHKLSLLLETLREELSSRHKYKVLFEYVMLAGVNDSMDDARRLVELVQGIPCKINLIQFNPHSGSQFMQTDEDKMIKFRNILAEGGCTVLMRFSRGNDQMAACGQLGMLGAIQAPVMRVPEQFRTALNASV